MSRTLPIDVASLITAPRGEIVHLLECSFSGGTLYLSTGPMTLPWNGHSWVGLGGALRFGGVQEVGDDRAQGVELELSVVDQTILAALLGQQVRGRRIKVYRARLSLGTNLIDNSDVEADTTGWQFAACTGVRDATHRRCGYYGVKITATNASFAATLWRRDGQYTPVTARREYTLSWPVWADPPAVGKQFALIIYWYDSATLPGTLVSATVGTLTPLVGGWNRLVLPSTAPWTPTPAAGALLQLVTSSAQGVFDVWTDAPTFAQGPDQGLDVPTTTAPIKAGQIVPDPLLLFNGFMNEPWEFAEQPSDGEGPGTATLKTRVVSRLAELEFERGISTNLTSHQRYFPGDTFFQVTAKLQGKKLKWPVP